MKLSGMRRLSCAHQLPTQVPPVGARTEMDQKGCGRYLTSKHLYEGVGARWDSKSWCPHQRMQHGAGVRLPPNARSAPAKRPSSHAFRQQCRVWVQTRRTFWKKCHCRQMTWSSQREDKEQTLEEMGGQHAPAHQCTTERKETPKAGGQSLTLHSWASTRGARGVVWHL